jgi:predicted membrane channel-forming protein YqfA (hemolysin III family)
MTTIATHNPVRTDLSTSDVPEDHRRSSRAWSLAGIGAGLAGIGTIVTTSAVNAVYDKDLVGHPTEIAAKLEDKAGFMFAFHSIAVVGALLMIVFAAGLFRRLRATLPGSSSLPLVAFSGLLGTAVVSVLGAGLDTEFMMTFAFGDSTDVDSANAAMYNHWIGTIPWVWVLAGLAGVCLHLAARRTAVPRWIGRVGLVLGGLTLVLGISPLEYLAGATGALLLLVTGIGFTVGDKKYRNP